MDVLSMAEKLGDARFWSPEQALQEARDDVGERGAFENGKKILIIGLDDSGDKYEVSFIQAGMSMSDCLALLEVMKSEFLSEMGYG